MKQSSFRFGNWLFYATPEQRRVFARLGFSACIAKHNLFLLGGKARSRSARRDARGRFV